MRRGRAGNQKIYVIPEPILVNGVTDVKEGKWLPPMPGSDERNTSYSMSCIITLPIYVGHLYCCDKTYLIQKVISGLLYLRGMREACP